MGIIMKKILYRIAIGVIILSASSCIDEVLINDYEGIRVTAGIDVESRTTFIDDEDWTHTHWVANDAIGLYTKDQSNVPYKAVSDGSYSEFVPQSYFSIIPEEGEKVYAYYPYSYEMSSNTILLPYTFLQRATEPIGTFLYSEASTNNNLLNFNFKHIFSYLKITIDAQSFKEYLPDGCSLEGARMWIDSDFPISANNAFFNVITQEIIHNNTQNKFMYYCPDNIDYNGTGSYTYLIPILPQPTNSTIRIKLAYPIIENKNSFVLAALPIFSKKTPNEGLLAGNVYTINLAGGDEEKEALIDFYNSTNGEQWNNNTNWLKDMSFSNWFGINELLNYNYVNTIELSNNNLSGTLPKSFATLMNRATKIDISKNAISGAIPDTVKNHSRWKELGWMIVPQDTRIGGGFDLTNSELFIPSTITTNLIDGSTKSLEDIFNSNKLTQIIYIDVPKNLGEIFGQIGISRINQHLDYNTKGLCTVVFTDLEKTSDHSSLVNSLKYTYRNVDNLYWMYGKPDVIMKNNMSYVFDSKGELVYVAPDNGIGDIEAVDEKYTTFLTSILGNPVKHDEFKLEFYTSTDYSRDGEVFTIQAATKGKGIDLVFLGEGFVDKDMEPEGKYETWMKEAADKLFELEPYKSFRDRFNIYGVKVVSPNAEFAEGAVKRINNVNDIAYEYAAKYKPNLPKDARMSIAVFYNADIWIDRSYCVTYSTGDFIAYVMREIENTLIHEIGGHGIAKLSDEYVEGGNESAAITQERKDFINDAYTREWGWAANIDYRNTPSTIRWSHLLNDSRYANDDIGIYEGAFLYGKGAYRSSENSMMNHNISWFNAPSREAIYKAVMTLSEGSEWTYDYEDFVKFDAKNIGSASSRSATMKLSPEEIQEIGKLHREPVFIKGSLRDAARNPKNKQIIVPLR